MKTKTSLKIISCQTLKLPTTTQLGRTITSLRRRRMNVLHLVESIITPLHSIATSQTPVTLTQLDLLSLLYGGILNHLAIGQLIQSINDGRYMDQFPPELLQHGVLCYRLPNPERARI